MPTKYPHGRLPSSSGASSMRWRAKESRELEAHGMTTTSRRRPGPGAPGDESRSPREDRDRDRLHRGNRAGGRRGVEHLLAAAREGTPAQVYTLTYEPCDRACPKAVPIHLHLGDPAR